MMSTKIIYLNQKLPNLNHFTKVKSDFRSVQFFLYTLYKVYLASRFLLWSLKLASNNHYIFDIIDVTVPHLALPKYQRARQMKKYASGIFWNAWLFIDKSWFDKIFKLFNQVFVLSSIMTFGPHMFWISIFNNQT